MLYNIHETTQAELYNCDLHLVAIVLGKEQAECLVEQLNTEHAPFRFVASDRSLFEPFVHFQDSSFAL